MIYNRKYLYKRDEVDGVEELDYLQTSLVYQDFPVEEEIIVTDSIAYRPDLISKRAYGSFHYGWLIMDHNDILDPYEQLVTGTVLEIPRMEDYFTFFNENSNVSKGDRLAQGVGG